MKRSRQVLINLAISSALSILALPAMATTDKPYTPMDFKAVDANKDGKLSLDEYLAQGGQEKAFLEGDVNHDSSLNSEEFVKANANSDRMKAGSYLGDSMITAKVKALLLKEDGIKGLEVGVKTHQGVVQLSGWVSKPDQMMQAEKIAQSVEGVKRVDNSLQVRR